MLQEIEEKLRSLSSINREEVSWLYHQGKLEDLGRLANIVRDRYHEPDQVTYLKMSIINFTNICVAGCDYCAFYVWPHEKGGYLLSFLEICKRIEKHEQLGGTLVGFNSGFNPELTIDRYVDLFKKIHHRFPHLIFFEMTVAEFMFACHISKVSYEQGARLFKEAGVQWITGGGAEVLDEQFRKRHSPGKFSVKKYLIAQRAIIDAGIGSTATMVIGFDESIDERLNHLEQLRNFQESLQQKLPSFLCWVYKPMNNRLGGKEIALEEYLKWLAICRIYLTNFKHIRTSVLTKNEGALKGLDYGADDFDLPLEDEVTEKAGATISSDFDCILLACKNNGYNPVMRQPF